MQYKANCIFKMALKKRGLPLHWWPLTILNLIINALNKFHILTRRKSYLQKIRIIAIIAKQCL
jgi:hypothetical protein